MRKKDPTLKYRTEKRCPHCTLTKPRLEFYNRTANADGLSPYCKACTKERRREMRIRAPETPGAEAKFWSRVEKTETCWLWRGGITTEGYGRFFYRGKDVPAHHMPIIFDGCEPPRYPMVCDHLCKVRHCVHPEHVRVVTQGTNSTENSESPLGRNSRKERCPQGHPYSPENTAMAQKLHPKSGKPTLGRICLTCHPTYWRHAVVPRSRPAGSRIKRGDPDFHR